MILLGGDERRESREGGAGGGKREKREGEPFRYYQAVTDIYHKIYIFGKLRLPYFLRLCIAVICSFN